MSKGLLNIELNGSQWRRVAARLAGLHEGIPRYIASALRSEGYRLKLEMGKYIRTSGYGTWRPYSKLSIALRRGRGGFPRVFSRLVRYQVGVRGDSLSLQVGIFRNLAPGYSPKARPPSNQAVRIALSYVSGGRIRVTRASQIRLAEELRAMGYSMKKIRKLIPKQGVHQVKPRPFVEPVVEPQKDQIPKNVLRMVLYRIATGRKMRR